MHSLNAIRSEIARCMQAAGRDPDSLRLMAVSKTQPQSAIQAAYNAGQRLFGENRVQEAQKKFTELKLTHSDLEVWLIGPLQTNKTAAAVALFDGIATLDRPKLAEILASEMRRQGRRPQLMVEVNIGAEPQKSGLALAALPNFLQDCRQRLELPIIGLMCIPPINQDPAPYFRQLKQLGDENNLPHCSMGMSGDYQTAIACGSTMIRLGSAVFGEREP
jgi:PLP dependent protein